MAQFDLEKQALVGAGGLLSIRADDEITRKLSMLIEGECEGLGPLEAARKFGFSKQRYFQLRAAFTEQGAQALQSQQARAEDPLSTHGGSRPPGDSASLPRSRSHAGGDRPEALPERLGDQHPQRAAGHRRVTVFKKKLYQYRPITDWTIETQRTKKRTRAEPCDPLSLERGVRQLLADKVSGNLVGLWLLIPEHLRLGTWDLLCGWSGQAAERVEPRLALQMVHESALCSTGLRQQRSLSQRGFELANGLPFVASDVADSLPAGGAHGGGGPTPASRLGPHSPRLGRLRGKTAGHRPASHAQLQQAANAPLPRGPAVQAVQSGPDLLRPRSRHAPTGLLHHRHFVTNRNDGGDRTVGTGGGNPCSATEANSGSRRHGTLHDGAVRPRPASTRPSISWCR